MGDPNISQQSVVWLAKDFVLHTTTYTFYFQTTVADSVDYATHITRICQGVVEK